MTANDATSADVRPLQGTRRVRCHTPPARRLALLDDLTQVVCRLESGGNVDLPVFGATDERELLLRLVGAVHEVVRRHPVDDYGRCQHCRPTRSGCRGWLRWPTRKAPCLVLSIASFYATVPPEQVWLQLLRHLGINRDLREIRAWLAHDPVAVGPEPEPVWTSVDEPTQPDMTTPVPTIPLPGTEPSSGRHALTA